MVYPHGWNLTGEYANDLLGETLWTISGQCTGNADIPLTEDGIKQSRGTGKMLVGPGKLIDPVKLAHVFCSPRSRAVDTLDLLLGKEEKDRLINETKISITEEIREWDYGKYEGLRPSEIKARRTEQGLGKWNIWVEGCEGGEYEALRSLKITRHWYLHIDRKPEPVQERLDGLIAQINKIQEPFMHGGEAPDVLVVSLFCHSIVLPQDHPKVDSNAFPRSHTAISYVHL